MIRYFAEELEKIAMAPTTSVPKIPTMAAGLLGKSGTGVRTGKTLAVPPVATPGLPKLKTPVAVGGRSLQTKVMPRVKTVPSPAPHQVGSLVR